MAKKISVENMSEEDILSAQKQISEKCKKSLDKAKSDLDKYLKTYGLEAIVAVQLVKSGEANLILEGLKK